MSLSDRHGIYVHMPALTELVGRNVHVTWTEDPDAGSNGFHTQISLRGVLEQHPENKRFRVLVDDATYTYFSAAEVREVLPVMSTGEARIFLISDAQRDVAEGQS